MSTVRTFNLATREECVYVGITPREAVICAYAQHQIQPDWNTWDYETKYGGEVRSGHYSVSCGDWAALLEGEK